MKNNDVSRRGFLTGTAALGALSVIGLTGCAPATGQVGSGSVPAAGSSDDWSTRLNVDIASYLPGNTYEEVSIEDTIDCDILVIGAGASGTNAAARAAELGKKVILLEKTSVVGGSCNLSGSAMAYNSTVALAASEPVDTLPLVNAWVEDSHYRVDPASIQQLLDKSGEAADWMAGNGWVFTPGRGASSANLPDYDLREGLFRDMIEAHVVKAGGELMSNTVAKHLITDENGAVVGAVAVNDKGKGIQIDCEAVVVATGGYAGNAELVNEVFRFNGVLGGVPQNIGEGLEMAWKAGAQKPQNFGGQMLHQTLARATDLIASDYEGLQAKMPMILCYIAQVPNVGTTGVRFRNEEMVLSPHGSANTSAYQGSYHYVVISKSIIDKIEAGGLDSLGGFTRIPGLPGAFRVEYQLTDPWTGLGKVMDTMVEKGAGFKANSFADLAEETGIDVDLFTEQMENYEQYCAAGSDAQFGKAPQYLIPLGEGPYYIIISEENSLGSWGGILTNTNYEALDYNRIPVKGLYAVGNEAGSCLYNDTYVGSGISMANSITSGYICGTKLGESL